jgi:hypothetical protein
MYRRSNQCLTDLSDFFRPSLSSLHNLFDQKIDIRLKLVGAVKGMNATQIKRLFFDIMPSTKNSIFVLLSIRAL